MAATTTHQPTTTTIDQALTDAPPPPYHEINNDSDSDSDSEEQDLPHKVTINAGHTVTGSYNTIPISVSPATMANATKMSAALLLAVAKLNDSNAANGSSRRIRLDLTINCGVTVTGSKNVTGAFGLERKVQTNEVTAGDEIVAVAGAKRKADDEDTDVAPAKATKATRRL